MEIRVWRSFGSNNSTSYRIVGKFEDPAAAQQVADELRAFLLEATPLATYLRRPQRLPTDQTTFPVTETIDALASEHGFDWTRLLAEADASEDELEVVAEGPALVVYHPYCLGLGEDLPAYLRARGAEVARQSAGDPPISVLFRLPEDGGELASELTAFFAQGDEAENTALWRRGAPWTTDPLSFASSSEIGFFCDGKTVGFYLANAPSRIPMIKEWLARAGVVAPRVRICETGDLAKFRTIAGARCPGCKTSLEYLDMQEHDIPADQLACAGCGGMFDLGAFAG